MRKVVLSHVPEPTKNWQAFFERTHDGKAALKPLGKPCHDCAVTCGFYLPYAEALAKLPRDFQRNIAARWFCHNHPNRACRGNIDFLDKAAEAKP